MVTANELEHPTAEVHFAMEVKGDNADISSGAGSAGSPTQAHSKGPQPPDSPMPLAGMSFMAQ
jgi:hypothetical protein